MRILNVDTVLCLYKMSAMPRVVIVSAEEVAVKKKKGTKTKQENEILSSIISLRVGPHTVNVMP